MEDEVNISRGTTAIPTQPKTEQPTQQAVARTYDFPVQIISLPSEGKCYAPSNPLSKGTLEIKFMTAKEEDILSSDNEEKRIRYEMRKDIVAQVLVQLGSVKTSNPNPDQ